MTRPANVSPCSLASVLIAGLVGLSVAATAVREAREQHRERDRADAPAEVDVQADPLRGLWMRYDRRGEGDPLRFWYFHGDGKGLYRYGAIGLTNTHSFDYVVRGSGEVLELELRFRKSGERHHSRVRLERDGAGDQWLVILDDPREAGARYRFVPSDLGEALGEDEGEGEGEGEGESVGEGAGAGGPAISVCRQSIAVTAIDSLRSRMGTWVMTISPD